MIVCVLLPYFAATLARRERGIADSVPLIVRSGQKVAATCAAASARGIRPGMTLRQATWLCPEAEVLPTDRSRLRRHTDEVVRVLGQFTHLVEAEVTEGKGKARTPVTAEARQSAVWYVDLERLARDETTTLTQLVGTTLRKATALDAACGLATGKFPAYAAATGTRAGHVRVIAPGEEASFLGPLPVSLLPAPEETCRRLLLLGLETIGALAALPVSAVLAQCGKEGVLLHHLARGIDPRRVVPTAPQVVERVTREFEIPITDQQALTAILRAMATELSIRLQASGCMGKTLLLHLTFDGGTTAHQKTTLRTAASSSRFLTETLLRLFARVSVPAGVCAVVVTLADLVPFAGQQLELFPDQPKPREALQKRLSTLLTRPDLPDLFWIAVQDPAARRIEQRYQLERVVA